MKFQCRVNIRYQAIKCLSLSVRSLHREKHGVGSENKSFVNTTVLYQVAHAKSTAYNYNIPNHFSYKALRALLLKCHTSPFVPALRITWEAIERRPEGIYTREKHKPSSENSPTKPCCFLKWMECLPLVKRVLTSEPTENPYVESWYTDCGLDADSSRSEFWQCLGVGVGNFGQAQ